MKCSSVAVMIKFKDVGHGIIKNCYVDATVKKLMQKVRCFKQTQLCTNTSLQSKISLYCFAQIRPPICKEFNAEVQIPKMVGKLSVC